MDQSWLGSRKKESKFINKRLGVGEEYVGIYTGVLPTTNDYGNTFHYLFKGDRGEEVFDSKNPMIAEKFSSIPFNSKVKIKKFSKDGRTLYDVTPIKALGGLD